jgi:hypothetical protein
MLFAAHSGWRYVVLVVLAIALVKYLIGWLGKSPWSSFDNTLNRVAPIVIDIQWLLGLAVWVANSWWNSADRPAAWEHPLTMTVAVAVASIFAARARRASTDESKHRTAFLGYLIATVLIVLGVVLVVSGFNIFEMGTAGSGSLAP